MRYSKLVHWSEGQFLQPHHFQQMQKSIFDTLDNDLTLVIPFKEGICSIDIDKEALNAKRVVINSFSAIMPDGTRLSQPGNCNLSPLTIDVKNEDLDKEITVYLAVSNYKKDESNLVESVDSLRRYVLHEQNVLDENTGDNDVTVIMRKFKATLVTDPKIVPDCSVLPILKLTFVALDNHEPTLTVCDSYIPPCVVLERHSKLFSMVYEFSYELKSCKLKILADIDSEGYDVNLLSGSAMLRIMQLQILNKYITTISAHLIPNKVSPFSLYIQLASLLSELQALFPLAESKDVVGYNHYDLYAVFSELTNSIRALISSQGQASYIELVFNQSPNDYLSTIIDENTIINGKEYYLALNSESVNLKGLIDDIEEGDKFRLLDKSSHDSRIRGIKLSYVRFPPRYLPVVTGNTVIFKVMKEESSRIWRYVLEDKEVVIDYAKGLFSDLKAKMYVAIINEG